MDLVDDQHMQPQVEEGIDKVEWKTKYDAKLLLADSFRSLRHVLKKFYKSKGTNSDTSLPYL